MTDVQVGSPAEAAGLRIGDIILTADGGSVTDMDALNAQLYTHAPGDSRRLSVYRNGRQGDVTVALTEKH